MPNKLKKLIRTYKIYNHKSKTIKNKKNYLAKKILKHLTDILKYKDKHIKEHGKQMEKLAKKFAYQLRLNKKEINNLKSLSNFHDIGKLYIPNKILFKPDKLTQKEWKIIKEHSEVGYHILLSIYQLRKIAIYALYHHERWDGKGYPFGLKQYETPLLSRIIALLDTFDTIIMGRPYKRPQTVKWAIKEIKQNIGKQFDPILTKFFIEFIRREFNEELTST